MTERKIDFKRIAVYKQDQKKKITQKHTSFTFVYSLLASALCHQRQEIYRYERIILLSTHVLYKTNLVFSQHTVKRLLENYRLILFIYFNAFQYLYTHTFRTIAEKK